MIFKEAYALEKVHGTSAHIQWSKGRVSYYSGGEKHDNFVNLFDTDKLTEFFVSLGKAEDCRIVIYGEAYGGKQQAMSDTYGKELKFIAFDVNIDGMWLDIPKADDFATRAGIEFVPYELIPTTIEALDKERDKDSIVAIRRGMGEGKLREGVVLRPPIEVVGNDGSRICSKHKRDEFREHKSPRLTDIPPDKLKILEEAEAIAEEWCVHNRLMHVLQHLTVDGVEPEMKDIPKIIEEMTKDILEEAKDEIVFSRDVKGAVGKKTVSLFKKYLKDKIHG